MRNELRDFYSVIKDCDEYIRFVFITGVSRFSKVNIFSQLNNLNDISLNPDYADICGYTQAELESNFDSYLDTVDKMKLKSWYNGYNFAGTAMQKVYNPFDILLFFANHNSYQSYWFETGTPNLLIDLVKQNSYYWPNLENIYLNQSSLSDFDPDNISLNALLFQTGYLTIQETILDEDMISYRLSYPNKEVRLSFNAFFAAIGSSLENKDNNTQLLRLALRENDFNQLHSAIISIYASLAHDWFRNNNLANFEGFYCAIFYSYLMGFGYTAIAEDVTNNGQIDITLLYQDKVLIFEFKLKDRGDALSAIAQIKQKGYALKYSGSNLPIYLVGISFDCYKRNVSDFAYELYVVAGS